MFESFLDICVVIIIALDFIQTCRIESGIRETKKKYMETQEIYDRIEKELNKNADKIAQLENLLENLSDENMKLKEIILEQAQTIEKQKVYHRKNLKLKEENKKLKEELEGGEEDEENCNSRVDDIRNSRM